MYSKLISVKKSLEKQGAFKEVQLVDNILKKLAEGSPDYQVLNEDGAQMGGPIRVFVSPVSELSNAIKIIEDFKPFYDMAGRDFDKALEAFEKKTGVKLNSQQKKDLKDSIKAQANLNKTTYIRYLKGNQEIKDVEDTLESSGQTLFEKFDIGDIVKNVATQQVGRIVEKVVPDKIYVAYDYTRGLTLARPQSLVIIQKANEGEEIMRERNVASIITSAFRRLCKLGDDLDQRGLIVEADQIDNVIKKLAKVTESFEGISLNFSKDDKGEKAAVNYVVQEDGKTISETKEFDSLEEAREYLDDLASTNLKDVYKDKDDEDFDDDKDEDVSDEDEDVSDKDEDVSDEDEDVSDEDEDVSDEDEDEKDDKKIVDDTEMELIPLEGVTQEVVPVLNDNEDLIALIDIAAQKLENEGMFRKAEKIRQILKSIL